MKKQLEVYICGGAVRNVLMGLPVNDMDYVVVGSSPEEMFDLGYHQVGADFPVFLSPNGDEYALARTERKSGHGYHGFEVKTDGVTLEDDLTRRDFTFNAMAVHVTEWERFKQMAANPTSDEAEIWMGVVLIDPLNGQADLKNHLARPCSLQAFIEDPLRLVRAARFVAVYDFVWSRELEVAARHIIKSGELATLSKERYFAEIEKVLNSNCTANQVREFSTRLLQFKLFDANFYFSFDNKSTMSSMMLAQFSEDNRQSYGAKLNALCPPGFEDAFAARFKFSGTLIDQIDLVHLALETGGRIQGNETGFPMGSATSRVMKVHHILRSGKTGVDLKLLEDMVEDFEEISYLLKWLPVAERICKEVCFATVTMPPKTPKHMYNVYIDAARQLALSKEMN